MKPHSTFPSKFLTSLLAVVTVLQTACAGDLVLDFSLESQGATLAGLADAKLQDAAGEAVSLTRCDLLLSGLALRRTDGSWLKTKDWYGLLSFGQGRQRLTAGGVPSEKFAAVRFYVGPDAKANMGDPNVWPAEHPLHPLAAGLHWSWQDGYVFLALEGHLLGKTQAGGSGWSWHLGTNPLRTLVELPVELDGATAGTLELAFDAAVVLKSASMAADGLATHSRPGDLLAPKLAKVLPKAFSVKRVRTDRFQPVEAKFVGTGKNTQLLYPLKISQRLPKVTLPPDNVPTVAGVALGERLFLEKRLSVDASIACVDCHKRQAGFTDTGKALSVGVGGKVGKFNAMPLFNLAWQKEFFWDGRVSGLRNQIWHPITDPVEMAHSKEGVLQELAKDGTYVADFAKAFGSPGITADRLALAIEQFLLTLVSQDAKYDRVARGLETLTEQEQHGLQLFITEHDPSRGLRGADCFHCHGGNLFTNHQFTNNGLAGEVNARSEVTGRAEDKGKFRVPSLRNIAATGPYMHDGRFTTLEQVVEHYNTGVSRSATLDPNLAKHPATGLGLSKADQAALVAFLKTLTDESFLGKEP